MRGAFSYLFMVKIPYIANRSRWKSFADGQGITNSLENFRGLLTPVNLKETRSHIRTLFNTTKYRRTMLDRFRTRLCRLLTGLYKRNLSPSVSVAGGLCHKKSRNMQCGTRYSTRHTNVINGSP